MVAVSTPRADLALVYLYHSHRAAEEARSMDALLAQGFNQAAPFPYIVLDGSFPPPVLRRAVQAG